jgi:hypothetical protein
MKTELIPTGPILKAMRFSKGKRPLLLEELGSPIESATTGRIPLSSFGVENISGQGDRGSYGEENQPRSPLPVKRT